MECPADVARPAFAGPGRAESACRADRPGWPRILHLGRPPSVRTARPESAQACRAGRLSTVAVQGPARGGCQVSRLGPRRRRCAGTLPPPSGEPPSLYGDGTRAEPGAAAQSVRLDGCAERSCGPVVQNPTPSSIARRARTGPSMNRRISSTGCGHDTPDLQFRHVGCPPGVRPGCPRRGRLPRGPAGLARHTPPGLAAQRPPGLPALRPVGLATHTPPGLPAQRPRGLAALRPLVPSARRPAVRRPPSPAARAGLPLPAFK